MLLKFYFNCLQKFPLLTQMISAGTLAGSGDMIAQTLIEKRSVLKGDFVYGRTIRFFGLGCFLVAPTLKVWYQVLERYVHLSRYPKLTPLCRVALDQIMFAPCFMSTFLISLRKLEGDSFELAITKWRRDFVTIYLTGLTVWPPAQMINFYFVPLQHRIMFVQTVALFWNTFLAWRTNIIPEDVQVPAV